MKKKIIKIILLIFIVFLLIILIVPDPAKILYQRYGLVLTDENGIVLRSYLNNEDSWCIPSFGQIPSKLKTAVILSEDRWFYFHPGINPVSIIRAIFLNLKNKKIISGASTISMQVSRIAGRNKRNILSKILEILQAFKLEIFYSKNYILKLYLNYAPYGGNIYGYKAALLKYFGKNPESISWAEAATLAILPNAPGVINPIKSPEQFKVKRNKLLYKLFKENYIDSLTYEMSLKEEIPFQTIPFAMIAPHFCEYVKKNLKFDYGIIQTTLNYELQDIVQKSVENHHEKNIKLGIENISAIVIDVETAEIKAYVGSQNFYDNAKQGQVDGVISPRSTGSVLKPFLYALAIDRGIVLPESLVEDIPTTFGSYTPSNSDGKFNGMVTVKDALIKSLNVPAVLLLSKIGVDNFYRFLKRAGLMHLFRSSEEYGLPLILGGAEASLLEISSLYLGLARYGKFAAPKFIKNNKKNSSGIQLISEGSSYLILNILKDLYRPNSEQLWEAFSSLYPIAWKTGTSYGYKDAWAIGVTPSYVVGVWCGNFDGRSNVLLSGSKIAGSLMLDIFRNIPEKNGKNWFIHPDKELTNFEICAKTGYAVGPFCQEKRMVEIPISMIPLKVCPYHTVIYTTIDGKYEVCSSCWTEAVKKYILNFPAKVSQYLRDERLLSETKPPHNPLCTGRKIIGAIDIIYPFDNINIVIPRDFNKEYQKIIFKAAHKNKDSIIYWYLNDRYIGQTKGLNNLEYLPSEGENTLTILDGDSGESKTVKFYVIYSK